MTSTRRRQRSRAWCFTWVNADEISHGTVIDKFSGSDIEYVFQREKGEGGMIHFQGVIRFKNPRDGPGDDLYPLCTWFRCMWRKQVKYCTKVDTRIEGPWTNVPGLKWRRTIKSPLDGVELYPWQREIMDLIREEPDSRTVHWYWDKNGCTGKTSLAKHICMNYKGEAIYLNGCSRDVLCAVASRLAEQDIRIAIFGLTRQDQRGVSYRSLETLKDGIGFSGKYESGMFICAGMHVLVFANFPPDLDGLSRDRWRVIEITNG